MRREFVVGVVVWAVGIVACGAGCEDDGSQTQPEEVDESAAGGSSGGEESSGGEPSRGGLTWRQISKMSPDEARERLGAPTNDACDPRADLPEPRPTNRGLAFGELPFCEYSNPAGPDGAPYVVDGLLFSKGAVTALHLTVDGKLAMDGALAEALQIPKTWEKRTVHTQNMRTQPVHKLAYRVRTVPSGEQRTPQVIGMDVFSEPDDLDRVSHAHVYVESTWPPIVDIARIAGPSATSAKLTLPPTRSELEFSEDLYVELGLETVRFGPPPSLPRREEIDAPSAVEFPIELLREKPTSSAEALRGFLKRAKEHESFGPMPPDRRLGEARPHVFLGADRTAKSGDVMRLRSAFEEAGSVKIEMLGRQVGDWNESPAESGSTPYQSGIPVGERPSLAVRQQSESFSVEVDLRGVRIRTAQSMRADSAAELCPGQNDSPQVVCLAEGGDVQTSFEEVRRLRNAGDLEAAREKMQRAMARYDWATLFEALVELKRQEYPDSDRLLVAADPELPIALPMRVAGMFRRASCLPSLREKLGERAADLCEERGRRPPPLLPHVKLVPPRDSAPPGIQIRRPPSKSEQRSRPWRD